MVYKVQSKDDFQSKLAEAGGKLVVVDFYATWCGPCNTIAPKIEELANQMTDVVFLKVDVDECGDVAQDYGVRSMPTFVFIKGSQKIEEFSGANEKKLRELVTKHR